MKKRILLVSTGGTITMTRQPGGGIAPALSGQQLVEAVPGLADRVDIDIHAYSCLPGASLTLEHLCEIAAYLNHRLVEAFEGAIVVQGTDTIEETAFVLDLLVRSSKPVIVTGAMRGPEAAGAEGPGNLLASAIVAMDDKAKNLGCLVVLNDEVHAARFVRKTSTTLTSAFQSPNLGPLGWVAEGRFMRNALLERQEILPIPQRVFEYPVAVIKTVLGDDGRILDALPALGFRGAVIEALGAGHVPAIVAEKIEAATALMPIVLCTRVISGPIFTCTYTFAGSEMDLIQRGVITGRRLDSAKACLLLRLGLANGLAREALDALFQTY